MQTAYNALERTQQVLKVSEEALALRTESSRELRAGARARSRTTSSQTHLAVAEELDAKTLLLQSQLDYAQAHDELMHRRHRPNAWVGSPRPIRWFSYLRPLVC